MQGARIILLAQIDSVKNTEQSQMTFDPKGQIWRVTSGSNSKKFKKIIKNQGNAVELFCLHRDAT